MPGIAGTGWVLSCLQLFFRTTPLADGETEAREVRPHSSSGWNPITEGPKTEQVPEEYWRLLFLRTPGTGQALAGLRWLGFCRVT